MLKPLLLRRRVMPAPIPPICHFLRELSGIKLKPVNLCPTHSSTNHRAPDHISPRPVFHERVLWVNSPVGNVSILTFDVLTPILTTFDIVKPFVTGVRSGQSVVGILLESGHGLVVGP